MNGKSLLAWLGVIFGMGACQTMAAPAASTAPATTAPTTGPSASANDKFLLNQQRQQQQFKDECDGMPIVATINRAAIYRLFLDKGRLGVEVGNWQADELSHVKVEDATGEWLASSKLGRMRRAGIPMPIILVDRYDFDSNDPEAIWATYLNINPRSINLSCQSMMQRIICFQGPDALTLTVTRFNPDGTAPQQLFSGRARTLDQLRLEHPAEVRKYLTPLLQKLMSTPVLLPGPADAYEVFTAINPDPQAVAALEQIIPNLDAPSPTDRQAAAASLEHLGAAGVLAAMRRDPSDLSPEQQQDLKNFVARHRGKPTLDARAAARDPLFLLDCLELDAPGVRRAAFEALQSVMGGKLNFDPSLEGHAAEQAADQLRQSLAPKLSDDSTH